LARDAHMKAVYHVMGGCIPTRLPAAGDGAPTAHVDACRQHNSNLLDLSGQFKYVVLGGWWSLEDKTEFESGLFAAVDRIVGAGAIPVVFRDTPRFDHDQSQCVLRQARGWVPPETNCNIPYAAVLAEHAPDDQVIDRVREKYPQLIVIDLKELLCNPTECVSRLGNLAVYMDAHHLNSQAAQALAANYLRSHHNPFRQ
jgi:hypothetical protein